MFERLFNLKLAMSISVALGVTAFSIAVEAASTNSPRSPISDDQPVNLVPKSSLPACRGSDKNQWNQCVGTIQMGELGQYSGEIRQGRPDGFGRFNGQDGSIHEGEYRSGVPSGKGRYKSAKGMVYQGEFADGIANGEGRETNSDGTIYVGNYVNGAREGRGRLTFPDGRRYEGEFKADRADGYGTFSFRNGDSYVGVVAADELTDRGIYQFANGDRYVGTYKNFKPSGQGVFTSVSGLNWVGNFVDGIPKGRGTLYASTGELILEDQFDGFASFTLAKAKFDEAKRIERAKQQMVERSTLPVDAQKDKKSAANDGVSANSDGQPKNPSALDISHDKQVVKDNSQAAPQTNAALEADLSIANQGSRAPLSCRYDGDLLVSFLNCEVTVPQVVIENIRFENDICISGADYLAEYDRARSAPLTDMFNRTRAYLYFRPFDYRGVHRYREKVYILASGCKSTPGFSISANKQVWNWSRPGDQPIQIK